MSFIWTHARNLIFAILDTPASSFQSRSGQLGHCIYSKLCFFQDKQLLPLKLGELSVINQANKVTQYYFLYYYRGHLNMLANVAMKPLAELFVSSIHA